MTAHSQPASTICLSIAWTAGDSGVVKRPVVRRPIVRRPVRVAKPPVKLGAGTILNTVPPAYAGRAAKAALVVTEAVTRLVPGVVGNPASPQADSFSEGLLEHPLYTRPREFRGRAVPEPLLSGNHARIERFRREESLRVTRRRRPELLEPVRLSEEDRKFLRELGE